MKNGKIISRGGGTSNSLTAGKRFGLLGFIMLFLCTVFLGCVFFAHELQSVFALDFSEYYPKSTNIGNGTEFWNGDGFNGNMLDDLYEILFGEEDPVKYIQNNGADDYNYYGKYAPVADTNLNSVPYYVVPASIINAKADNATYGITITLGGQVWMITSLTLADVGAKSDQVILTLMMMDVLYEDGVDVNWPFYTIADYGQGHNMYSSSTLRKNLLEDSAFSMFSSGSFAEDYLVQPKYVTYQQIETMYGRESGYNVLPNEALKDFSSGWGRTSYQSDFEFQGAFDTPQRYDAWGEDYIWIPAVAETGGSSLNNSIWKLTNAQRAYSHNSSNYAWLRTGNPNYYVYGHTMYYGGDPATEAVSTARNVRPAIHLNLSAIHDLASPKDIDAEYTGVEQTLPTLLTKPSWYWTSVYSDESSIKVEYSNPVKAVGDSCTVTVTILNHYNEITGEGYLWSGEPDASKGESEWVRKFTLTVVHKKLDVNALSINSQTGLPDEPQFTDTSQVVAGESVPTLGLYYVKQGETEGSTTIPREKGATYTATVVLLDENGNAVETSGNYTLAKDVSITFTTTYSYFQVPEVETDTLTYNGSAQSFRLKGYQSGDENLLQVSSTGNITFNGTALVATDTGTYTVTFALPNTTNYRWSDGTTAPKTVTVTIEKIQISLEWDDTKNPPELKIPDGLEDIVHPEYEYRDEDGNVVNPDDVEEGKEYTVIPKVPEDEKDIWEIVDPETGDPIDPSNIPPHEFEGKDPDNPNPGETDPNDPNNPNNPNNPNDPNNPSNPDDSNDPNNPNNPNNPSNPNNPGTGNTGGSEQGTPDSDGGIFKPTITNQVTFTGNAFSVQDLLVGYNDKYMSISGDLSATVVGNYSITISLKDPTNTYWKENVSATTANLIAYILSRAGNDTADVTLDWEIVPYVIPVSSWTPVAGDVPKFEGVADSYYSCLDFVYTTEDGQVVDPSTLEVGTNYIVTATVKEDFRGSLFFTNEANEKGYTASYGFTYTKAQSWTDFFTQKFLGLVVWLWLLILLAVLLFLILLIALIKRRKKKQDEKPVEEEQKDSLPAHEEGGNGAYGVPMGMPLGMGGVMPVGIQQPVATQPIVVGSASSDQLSDIKQELRELRHDLNSQSAQQPVASDMSSEHFSELKQELHDLREDLKSKPVSQPVATQPVSQPVQKVAQPIVAQPVAAQPQVVVQQPVATQPAQPQVIIQGQPVITPKQDKDAKSSDHLKDEIKNELKEDFGHKERVERLLETIAISREQDRQKIAQEDRERNERLHEIEARRRERAEAWEYHHIPYEPSINRIRELEGKLHSMEEMVWLLRFGGMQQVQQPQPAQPQIAPTKDDGIQELRRELREMLLMQQQANIVSEKDRRVQELEMKLHEVEERLRREEEENRFREMEERLRYGYPPQFSAVTVQSQPHNQTQTVSPSTEKPVVVVQQPIPTPHAQPASPTVAHQSVQPGSVMTTTTTTTIDATKEAKPDDLTDYSSNRFTSRRR